MLIKSCRENLEETKTADANTSSGKSSCSLYEINERMPLDTLMGK